MSACVAHFRVEFGDGSNSFASSSRLRPPRTGSTIRRRNSAVYLLRSCVLGNLLVYLNCRVSVESGGPHSALERCQCARSLTALRMLSERGYESKPAGRRTLS